MSMNKLLLVGCVAAAAMADDCANFRKISDGECAEACVPSMVGLCPQSLIVKTGGLDAGHCADVNFTVADGTVDQKCGPCGTVTFNKFKQASVLSADGSIDLVTFDGAKATTHEWEAVNDPVMGGQSVSTFTVQKGAGVFDGEVKIVPFLHAAGFCNAETKGTQSFTDISSTDGIAFTMRNTGNLTGLQATVTTQGSGTGLKHGSYMGNFVVPNDGKTHTVAVKWADFSCEWRGQKIKCPTMQSQLGKVTQIGMSFGQAPNVPGTFHVELQKVSGVKLARAFRFRTAANGVLDTCTGPHESCCPAPQDDVNNCPDSSRTSDCDAKKSCCCG